MRARALYRHGHTGTGLTGRGPSHGAFAANAEAVARLIPSFPVRSASPLRVRDATAQRLAAGRAAAPATGDGHTESSQ